MNKVEASRDDIKKVVIALFQKQSDDNAKLEKIICETAELKYDPKEKLENQVMLSMVVDPVTDYIAGLISRDQCTAEIKDVVRERLKTQLKTDYDEEMTGEEAAGYADIINKGVDNIVDSYPITLKTVIFTNSHEEDMQYFQRVFKLAAEKRVTPESIFYSKELHKELIISIYTRGEYQKRMLEALLPSLNTNELVDLFLIPVIETLGGTDQEKKHSIAILKKTFNQTLDFSKECLLRNRWFIK